MLPALAITAVLACVHQPITLRQAERLVLAAPNIRASVVQRHARPFFEWIDRGPGGWRFDVNARNPCSGPGPCSTLLGHFAVSARTGEVADLGAGEDGQVVSSPEMRRLLYGFRRNCLRDRGHARISNSAGQAPRWK